MNMALISALLIFCFESLHGDITQAIVHIQSAIEMIFEDIPTKPREWSYPRIATQSEQISSAYDGNLLTAFLRLDNPSLALLGRKNGKLLGPAWRIFNVLFATREEAIPGAFRIISEARAHLDDIKWRILQQIEPRSGTATTTFPDLENIPLLAVNIWYRNGAATASSQHLAHRFAQWYDAFLPMLNHAMTPIGEPCSLQLLLSMSKHCLPIYSCTAILCHHTLAHDLLRFWTGTTFGGVPRTWSSSASRDTTVHLDTTDPNRFASTAFITEIIPWSFFQKCNHVPNRSRPIGLLAPFGGSSWVQQRIRFRR